LFIKCRKYSNQNGKQSCKAHNKTGAIGNDKFTDAAFTSSALYGHNHRGGDVNAASVNLLTKILKMELYILFHQKKKLILYSGNANHILEEATMELQV
jgi:hypothetical protein